MSPLSTFQSARILRVLTAMEGQFADSDVVLACEEAGSRDEYRAIRPRTLRQCAAVCVVPDQEGWISRGVWEEMWNALEQGIRVYVADENGSIRWFPGITVLGFITNGQRRFARLVFRDWSQGTGNA